MPTRSRVDQGLIGSMAEVVPTRFMQDQSVVLAMQPAMAYLAAREMTSFMAAKSKMYYAEMAINRA